jgi:uncharacterized protein (TIGR02145 family)
MKRRSWLIIVTVIISMVMAYGQASGTVTDIDGNVYTTVTIGTQVWMAENLKVTKYRDGTAIPNVTDGSAWAALTTGAYCIYNNNASNEVDTYGALYNWYAAVDVHNIAPTGWHVPTDAEWKELEKALGMSQAEADGTGYRGTNEGSKLSGNANLWVDGVLENDSEFGSSGFNALPGGDRTYTDGSFRLNGEFGNFWASSGDGAGGAFRLLHYSNTDIYRVNSNNLRFGYAIRCVRDTEGSLPVELHSFSAASTRSNAITLQWVTESEVENLGFIVERKHGKTDWVEFATYLTHTELQGQGSVTSRTEYSFTDETVEPGTTYDYRLADVSYEGVKEYHSMTFLGVEVTELPEEIVMMPAYPNPFNPTTTIRYSLPKQSTVSLTVYDVQGQEIVTIQNGEKPPGNYEVQWSGIDQSGNPVSTGVYFCRLQTGVYSKTIKMVYLR